VGGNADFFAVIKTKENLQEALLFAEEKGLPTFFLGGGSNILFLDKGFRGVVLKMENKKIQKTNSPQSPFEKGRDFLEIESGTRNSEVFQFAKKQDLDFAIFVTIPGTIGGALYGNAGIPNCEISDFFVSAEVFDREKKEFFIVEKDFFNFSYRYTAFHDSDFAKRYIIWSVILKLEKLPQKEIQKKAKELLKIRKSKQPWGLTGGSFFKNPSKENSA